MSLSMGDAAGSGVSTPRWSWKWNCGFRAMALLSALASWSTCFRAAASALGLIAGIRSSSLAMASESGISPVSSGGSVLRDFWARLALLLAVEVSLIGSYRMGGFLWISAILLLCLSSLTI